MPLAEKVGLALLIAAFVVQCAARVCALSAIRRLWLMGIVGVGVILASWAYLIYAGWRASELGKFFLPPHRSPEYFFLYVGKRFFLPWGIALAAGFLVLWLAARMNRKYGGRFFESDEPALAGLCFFMSGYPAFFFYLPAMLFVGVGVSVVYQMRGWGRAPLYYWWVPTAVFVIILKTYVIPESVLNFFIL
ncbi:MAG: hypothetical protein HYY10_01835 [Candidatus Liptonbacteria bacterium]|nr:hypothetical protein [Candidatus Liptonbacteria bacterium]